MATIPSDAYRAAAAPHSPASTVRVFDITEADASVTLPTGVYEIRIQYGDAVLALIRSGAAPTPPPSAGPDLGVVLYPGDVVSYFHDATVGDGTLHARLAAPGSSALFIASKAGL
jgi:hypothetical protein